MGGSTYFVQECPTCGRNLQVRLEYLGKRVVCQHCGGEFEAHDPTAKEHSPSQSGLAILDRANELLANFDRGRTTHC